MKAYIINPQTQTTEEIDIELKADTAYNFFASLLIDESLAIEKHVIFSDTNALSNGKKPFMVGSQLIVGDALILGRDGLEDTQATIPQKDLELLINYNLTPFYLEVLELLSSSTINLYKTFSVMKKEEKIDLNTEWVLYTFDIADDKTKEYFITNLKETLANKESVEEFMQKMAQLALNTIQ